MVDKDGKEIKLTWRFKFDPCGHEVDMTAEQLMAPAFRYGSRYLVASMWCPRCKALNEMQEKEEVVRRMEMGLGV